MKSTLKILVLLIISLSNVRLFAQDDKTVTLVVSGSGKTQEDAKQNALRSAIEQAFGTFISSKTEILNDNLVKDEIVSVANGNIQKFDIVSEVQMPDGNYATTLNAIVSVTKLTSFAESKGVVIEFKGALFGANIKQQKLNEEAEFKSIINLCEITNLILSKSLDYSVENDEPKKSSSGENYELLIKATASPNKNYDNFINYFTSTIQGIAMTNNERENYGRINKATYCLHFQGIENKDYFLRNVNSAIALQNLFLKTNLFIHDFIIKISLKSKIDTIHVKTYSYNTPYQISKNLKSNWSLNNNGFIGFPDFGFPQCNVCPFSSKNKKVKYSYGGVLDVVINSWAIYEEMNYYISKDVLFNKDTYFTGTGTFYKEEENQSGDIFRYIDNEYPVTTKNREPSSGYGEIYEIGVLNFRKLDYYSKYLASYSEAEISEIHSIEILQKK